MDEDKILPERERPTEKEAYADAVLAIVTGYDTTASVLAGLFYYLIRSPNAYARLRAENDEYFQRADSANLLDSSKLGELPYLNAVMYVHFISCPHNQELMTIYHRNEALRLANPGNILQRATTSQTGGRWLGTKWVAICSICSRVLNL